MKNQENIKLDIINCESLTADPGAKNMPLAEIPPDIPDSLYYVKNNTLGELSLFNEINEKEKICPFEIEDLSLIYNLDRFPKRKRRKPRKLKKFNFKGNVALVTAYKLANEGYRDYKNDRGKAIKRLAEYIDIKESTFETKLSQLNTYVYGNEKKKLKAEKEMSEGLFSVYHMFKDVDYNDLLEIFINHELYSDILEIGFMNLRDKSLANNRQIDDKYFQ